MNIVAFIFARGESKGLPGKNLISFAGRPLLAWAIEQAKAIPKIRRIIVSTDSKKIAEAAKKYGAEVPFLRPAELATDEAPEWLAWQHALQWIKSDEGRLPDAMVSVPTTAPLRKPQDIEAALALYEKEKIDAVITVTPAHRNPWFNMVTVDQNGTAQIVISPKGRIVRRQEAPEVYDMTTVAYVVRPTFVMKKSGLFSGRVCAIQIPKERALDIDNKLDLDFAEFLQKRGKIK
jgi:N-acylneuraminate cytidylyltransferase